MEDGDNTLKAATEDLRSFADRITRLEEEKAETVKEVNEQIKEVYANAKARGYDVKALRAVLALRKKDEETLAAVYLYSTRMGIFA